MENKRWSKKPDWDVQPKGTGYLQEYDKGRYEVEELMMGIRWLKKLLLSKWNLLKDSDKYWQGEIWWDLINEESGPEGDKIATDETDFYSGGTLHRDVHDALTKLTDEGYDVRPHWRELREIFSDIWDVLPKMYKLLVENEVEDKDFKPEDYDPDKPFPQYPIPEDIDE